MTKNFGSVTKDVIIRGGVAFDANPEGITSSARYSS